jgi:hypothetical protein
MQPLQSFSLWEHSKHALQARLDRSKSNQRPVCARYSTPSRLLRNVQLVLFHIRETNKETGFEEIKESLDAVAQVRSIKLMRKQHNCPVVFGLLNYQVRVSTCSALSTWNAFCAVNLERFLSSMFHDIKT